MGPDMASKPIPAVHLTAPASVCQPLTNERLRRGPLHAVHMACVDHQVVKVVEVLAAKYTACEPLALENTHFLEEGHSTGRVSPW
jgi:hypothetical protein